MPDPEMANDREPLTLATLAAAESLIIQRFTPHERTLMLRGLEIFRQQYDQLRAVTLENGLAPALRFDPRPAAPASPPRASRPYCPQVSPDLPNDLNEIAFWPIPRLAALLRAHKITSLDLTRLYLDRLKRYDPLLRCVVTFTEDLALQQSRRADEELAAGIDRGPLHGIPWGAKDLLATRGIPTTWGAAPYRDQVPTEDAAVVQRLSEAGAVLVAKLSMGSLAWGDIWFGGKTRNPWRPVEGSSGSSAGSAAAVAAGLVGFAIGSETWGSIVSPCTRCGVTGLRPTYGRVSRHGAMALSWSMDKLGPICHTAEDCGLVLQAIYGPDGHDGSVVDAPYEWPPAPRAGQYPLEGMRVGYLHRVLERERPTRALDQAVLDSLRSLGAELRPIELPAYPIQAMSLILDVEAAAAFDELTRSDRDDLLTRQQEHAWPNHFRRAHFIPAVEYVQANRLRALVMRAMAELMAQLDLYVAPTDDDEEEDNSLLTNLTGHPVLCLPTGFLPQGHHRSGMPGSITLVGRLYEEATLLQVGSIFQQAAGMRVERPPKTP
jgi:Asp-tRNA(Asn)/Glu-tRNA(Gln) amidotransferase A subunit family amidase